jgi:hypothetical protein
MDPPHRYQHVLPKALLVVERAKDVSQPDS